MDEAWAAIAAGVIAAAAGGIGLVMAKENKTSEFRQAWIQELRALLVTYHSIILNIKTMTCKGGKEKEIDEELKKATSLLSEINLRINYADKSKEENSLHLAMTRILEHAETSEDGFHIAQANLTMASFEVLKKEWKRVKKGEFLYRFCMYPCLAIVAVAIAASAVYGFCHFETIWRFLIT